MNELLQRLLPSFTAELRDEMVGITCDLVEIPSPTGEEGAIADYVAHRFREIDGMDIELQEVEPDRYNVIGRLRGSGRGRSLLLGAHFDTGMTGKDPGMPFGLLPKATLDDEGWIYGLGVSNMKSAFAAYFGAIKAVQRANIDLRGDIILAGVIGETEKSPTDDFSGPAYRAGGWGTMYAAQHGVVADAAIIGEPTGLRVQTGNSSYVFAKVSTKGVSRHTWSKEHGDDAIDKAVRVLEAFRAWEPEFAASHAHPTMGTRIGFGAIRGGNPFQPAVNPARTCTLYLDFRFPPTATIMDIHRQVRGFLDDLREADPVLETELSFFLCRNGYEITDDEPLVQTVERAHQTVFGAKSNRPEPYRYDVSADTSILHEYGVPALTYGPGGIRKDGVYDVYDRYGEVVSIDNLVRCTQVYAQCIAEICG